MRSTFTVDFTLPDGRRQVTERHVEGGAVLECTYLAPAKGSLQIAADARGVLVSAELATAAAEQGELDAAKEKLATVVSGAITKGELTEKDAEVLALRVVK